MSFHVKAICVSRVENDSNARFASGAKRVAWETTHGCSDRQHEAARQFAKLSRFSIRTDVVFEVAVQHECGMEAMTLEWRRRFATERRHRFFVFAAIAGLSISLALFWLLFAGVWVILLFTALELACVAAAFWWIEQGCDDRDRVEVTDNGVNVIRVRRRKTDRFAFTRNWLAIELETNSHSSPSGVRLRQSGRTVALVEFLSVPEQIRALGELRHALSLR